MFGLLSTAILGAGAGFGPLFLPKKRSSRLGPFWALSAWAGRIGNSSASCGRCCCCCCVLARSSRLLKGLSLVGGVGGWSFFPLLGEPELRRNQFLMRPSEPLWRERRLPVSGSASSVMVSSGELAMLGGSSWVTSSVCRWEEPRRGVDGTSLPARVQLALRLSNCALFHVALRYGALCFLRMLSGESSFSSTIRIVDLLTSQRVRSKLSCLCSGAETERRSLPV